MYPTTLENAVQTSTYDIVSKLGYLLGVPRKIFDQPFPPMEQEIFQRLEKDKNARIVRNICQLRTQIVRNYKAIHDTARRMELRSILNMPEYVSAESIRQLTADGVRFFKKGHTPNQTVVELNRILSDRLNNCKSLFPGWLKWDYLRSLFVLPAWLSEAGAKAAAQQYYSHRDRLPYQVLLNWEPIEEEGNLFSCDLRFVRRLYEANNDYFTDTSKVCDAGSLVKGSIYEFLEESTEAVLIVDCENSDPYKLCAALKALNGEGAKKFCKVILMDDEHSAAAWPLLEQHIAIPVEHVLVPRLKKSKSLVDHTLISRACKEFYENDVRSFVIVASDSDYWALVSTMPQVRFLFLVERENFGADMKAALANSGICYAYMDDFYQGYSEDIKRVALRSVIACQLKQALQLNVYDLLEEALAKTRIFLSPQERQRFYEQHLRNIQLNLLEDGRLCLALKQK